MRETGMVIECRSRKHKFLLGLTDDGYRRKCPVCSGELLGPREAFSANEIYGMKTIGQAWRDKSKTNEIEITMSSTNEPPKVKLNGETIDSIVELGYEFVTKEHESNGYHNFTVKYVDKKTNTVRTVSANKMLEG